MSRALNTYQAANAQMDEHLTIEFKIGALKKEKTDLEKWLTERYALFQDTPASINAFEIHHLEWPISEIQLHSCEVHYPRFSKMLAKTPDLAQYSEGVKVLAWGKQSTMRNS